MLDIERDIERNNESGISLQWRIKKDDEKIKGDRANITTLMEYVPCQGHVHPTGQTLGREFRASHVKAVSHEDTY